MLHSIKKYFKFIVGLYLLISFSVIYAAPSVLNIQKWNTPNGASVYFVQASGLPIVDIKVMFNAGSSYDGNEFGLASLVNQMIGAATKDKNADQIADGFDATGAKFSNSMDREQAFVQLRSMMDPKYLNSALSLFHDVLVNAVFSDQDFSRIKNQSIASIEVAKQRPEYVANDKFYNIVYQNQPCAHPYYGTLEGVNKIQKEDVDRFYHQYYVGNNAIMVIVGDLNKKVAQDISYQLLKDMPSGNTAPALAEAKPVPASQTQVPFPSAQDIILDGQVGIKFSNPDYFPLRVGNVVFGDGATMRSRIYNVVREEHGLAYEVASQFVPSNFCGPFIIQLLTRADQGTTALQLIQNALVQFIQKGPSETEVSDAKEYLIGRFQTLFSSNEYILALVSQIAFYHLPLDYLDRYQANIKAVTPAQVKVAFAKQINPNQMVTVIVGPDGYKASK